MELGPNLYLLAKPTPVCVGTAALHRPGEISNGGLQFIYMRTSRRTCDQLRPSEKRRKALPREPRAQKASQSKCSRAQSPHDGIAIAEAKQNSPTLLSIGITVFNHMGCHCWLTPISLSGCSPRQRNSQSGDPRRTARPCPAEGRRGIARQTDDEPNHASHKNPPITPS